MDKMKFTEEDKEKLIEFLNFMATKFEANNWKTADTMKHFKLLAHIQQAILPKIDANILEVIKVVEPDDDKQESLEKENN